MRLSAKLIKKLKLLQCAVISVRKNHGWRLPEGKDTGIVVYNSQEKRKVPLVLKDGPSTWYSCGPTVYDSAHIGHACCYVKLDIVQRILRDYFDVRLITAMGVTDIDDKIIKRSKMSGQHIKTITDMYEAEFWRNLSDLGIILPDVVTRVSQNIPTITDFIRVLNEKGFGYRATDGSLYFDTNAYGKYGKFIKAHEDVESEPGKDKKTPADFALWKGHKEGEPHWKSDWGDGRPGWHIECSAMVSRLFGSGVDFHAGGIDLKFPHHENEEAQSCAYHSNDQWVNYWIHTGHLHLKQDVKMSKSLKNTISINDMLAKHGAETFRMACLLSHYRYAMEFTDEAMENAKSVMQKVKFFLAESGLYVNNNSLLTRFEHEGLMKSLEETKGLIDESLRDDFDTSACIKHLLKLIKDTNIVINGNATESLTESSISIVLIRQYVKGLFDKFGLFNERAPSKESNIQKDLIDVLVQFRRAVRSHALSQKNMELLNECDNVRNAMKTLKISINDKPGETMWMYEK